MQTLRSIQCSLDLIERRLLAELSVLELAEVANMSLWHFQRTFSACVGESVGRYIRRRRIAEAANRLRDYDGTLLELALDFQFESHEAFTRAFKAELSMTPSDWRRGVVGSRELFTAEQLTQDKLNQRYLNMSLLPELEYRDPAFYIGIEGRFISARSEEANNLIIIPKLWDQYFARLVDIPTNEVGVSYGLSHSPEAHGRSREHADEALYLAAARVDEGADALEGMVYWESPGGLFARFEHRGPAATIGETVAYIYGKWLPCSDYERTDGPDIQRIDQRFIPSSDQSVLDIYIPVKATLLEV